MSWSRRQVWRLLAAAAAIAPLAGLAACGFQPLYGSDGRRNLGDASVAASLATVRIDPLRDPAGQPMHNFLRDRLNPEGQPVSPSYRLQLQLVATLSELGVRPAAPAIRATLRLDAVSVLLSSDPGTTVERR